VKKIVERNGGGEVIHTDSRVRGGGGVRSSGAKCGAGLLAGEERSSPCAVACGGACVRGGGGVRSSVAKCGAGLLAGEERSSPCAVALCGTVRCPWRVLVLPF